MPTSVQRELTVFPTELALRRWQREQALAHGFVDASHHLTFARLRKLCLPYARLKGRPMGPAEALLMRRQVVEVAQGHFAEGTPLGSLSASALADVLERLVSELAALPDQAAAIVEWMLDRPRHQKLYQLGTLHSVWNATLMQDGLADALGVNRALLKLLKGRREDWPPLLRDAKSIVFRSVRWFMPFEESCLLALNQKMKLRVESALPDAHAEVSGDRLGQAIRAEISSAPWAAWAEDLGDALAVDCPDVAGFGDAGRIAFSRSAGAYGEIEDLARRVCWHLGQGVAPDRVALVVPDIGTVQDIVPHVFSRFQIPYFFRRGRPVLSSPCVKAFMAWLAFPLRAERDALIDLVRNPALRFEHREQTVEQLLKEPPRLDGSAYPMAQSGAQALDMLRERVDEPDDHFNAAALQAVAAVLESLGERRLPLRELVDLLSELLENATVRPRDSHEQGVWILNPHDAVGLEFDVVLFAGLNEGGFPALPLQDALLGDAERHFLRTHLEGQGRRLPKLALPQAEVLYGQQSVLFLSALGMAREQVVLSCQTVDQEGNEKGPGEFYRKLWNLAGWPARPEIDPCPYDQWRTGQLGEEGLFSRHLEAQRSIDPEERLPMPGESFLPVVPLPLCRAADEALQAAVQGGGIASESEGAPSAPLGHLVDMLAIEAERDAFLDTPVGERAPSIYCGHIGAVKDRIAAWFHQKREFSPTALEALAQCRYVFLLEKVFGLREPRLADDAPDPMDRGGLIHSILRDIYVGIASGEAGIDLPRRYAVLGTDGWRLRGEGGSGALPLAVFDTAQAKELLGFAGAVADRRMDAAVLGHPGVWAAEREKVRQIVLNLVRHDVQSCAAERRYPALFEIPFGGDTAVDLGEIRLKGVIDRIDLVFAETGALQSVRVLDYKGSSRARDRREDYIDDIRRNLDCQLPVYAFAAQQCFFGGFNTPEANAMTAAGYLFYERDFSKLGNKNAKSLLPLEEADLVDGFLRTLRENLRRVKAGDFAVDPLVAAYTDYVSVCRTEAVARDELE